MIKVEHLTKCYGSFTAVNDLSFEIDDGHVYGFLGPNGAGKSTTMNIMTGCLSATAGRVSIDGHDILEEPKAAKKLIGYLPELPPLYVNETPFEYLRFAAEAKGLHGLQLKQEIERVITETGLVQMKDRLISALSKGYRQRVGIAQALLGNPKLIILDEPTVGLDPLQIIEIRELIRSLSESHTVIFSSHILSEVQAVCDRVLIISHGRLVAFDSTENLESVMTGSGEIRLGLRGEEANAAEVLRKNIHVTGFECSPADDGLKLQIRTDGSCLNDICCELVPELCAHGMPVYEISSHKADLEEIFLELTCDDDSSHAADSSVAASAGETGNYSADAADAASVGTDSDPDSVSDSNSDTDTGSAAGAGSGSNARAGTDNEAAGSNNENSNRSEGEVNS